MDGGEPDIPIYKVIECTGPTNTRVYKVAVYFRGKRLASSTGHSIQQAEMEAAKKALENSSELFPQLDYQKRVMAHSMKRQKGKHFDGDRKRGRHADESHRKPFDDDSNLPKQYRFRDKSKDNSSDALGSSSESDAESALPSDSSCSSRGSRISKRMIKQKHQKETELKCNNDKVEKCNEDHTPTEHTLATSDVYNSTINDKDDTVNNSDTDVSLESGEIL